MFTDSGFWAGLFNSVGQLVSNIVRFVSYFFSALMQQPFTLVIIVVLLLFSKKGGVKLGKAVDLSVGK